jgi:hypothetical protein
VASSLVKLALVCRARSAKASNWSIRSMLDLTALSHFQRLMGLLVLFMLAFYISASNRPITWLPC